MPVRLGEPRHEITAARTVVAQFGQVRSMTELLETYSNETALFYGTLMLTPLTLASKGIGGVSTAHVTRPDEILKRELTDLLKKYEIGEPSNRDQYVTAFERIAPQGRKFASDLHQLSVRTRQRHKVKGADPIFNLFKPSAVKSDAFTYTLVNPTLVKVMPKNVKGQAQGFEVLVEEGAWRIHGGGIEQIRALYGERKKQNTEKP